MDNLESLDEVLDYLNEGMIFNKSKNHDKVKKDIINILDKNSEKLSYKEKLTEPAASSSIPCMNKAAKGLESYFEALNITSVWITYVNYVEDHANVYCTALKGDEIYNFTIYGMYHKLSLMGFSSQNISSLGTISKDIIKLALEKNSPKFNIKFGKNSITCKMVDGITGMASNRMLYDEVEKYVNSKYPNYEVKYNKVTGKLTISGGK